MNDYENIMRCERGRTGNYGLDYDDDYEGLSDGDLMDMEYENYRDMILEAKYNNV